PLYYTLSLHDALPISAPWPRELAPPGAAAGRSAGAGARDDAGARGRDEAGRPCDQRVRLAGARADHRARLCAARGGAAGGVAPRSEEHTSELQSRENL